MKFQCIWKSRILAAMNKLKLHAGYLKDHDHSELLFAHGNAMIFGDRYKDLSSRTLPALSPTVSACAPPRPAPSPLPDVLGLVELPASRRPGQGSQQ